MNSTGERWYQGEANRLPGEVHVRSDASAEAEASFQRALEIARELGEAAVEQRAAVSLARLLVCDGGPAEARAQVAAIYESITEGFGTADLNDARDLLESLT